MDEKIKQLQKLIDSSKRIVFFGGAGVSTESGIKDFRSKDGLYKLHSKYGAPYEEMLSHHYFFEHTKTFYQFYYEFMISKEAKPNDAHLFLAKLEKTKELTVITQNIDGLHQMAGSKNVLELHGSVHRNTCLKCGEHYSLDEMMKLGDVPCCSRCGGLVKPDVVLYEEGLDMSVMQEAVYQLSRADLLIIAGTSLSVYPASGLIHYFTGKNLVVINKDSLNIDNEHYLEINEPVGEVFKQLHI